MEMSKATKTIIYLLLLCYVVCKISGDVSANDALASDSVVDSDISSLLNQNVLPRLELVLRSRMADILTANPSLLKYVSITDPDQAEYQQTRNKRLAGLENLDFMNGVFSRLPMRTNAAMSDLQQRMREAGRRKK